MKCVLLAAVAVLMLAFTGAALAQAPAPIKRTPLQKFDVPGTNYETVIGIDSYVVPPGAPHDAKTGAAGAKVIATYVVEKGKPLATLVP